MTVHDSESQAGHLFGHGILSHSSPHPLRKSQPIVPGGGDADVIHHGTDTTVRGGRAMLSAAGQGVKGGIKLVSLNTKRKLHQALIPARSFYCALFTKAHVCLFNFIGK